MNVNISEIALSKMDADEVKKHALEFVEKGTTADNLMQFLRNVIPIYETKKKEVLSDMIQEAYIDLVDQIWSDPYDIYLVQRLHELKKIAETLKIEINAIRGR